MWFPAIHYNISDTESHSWTVMESYSKCPAAGGPEKAPETGCTPCNEGALICYNFEPISAEPH